VSQCRQFLSTEASVDAQLLATATVSPAMLGSDHEILNLRSRHARTLPLAAVGYCWFADPGLGAVPPARSKPGCGPAGSGLGSRISLNGR